MRNKKSIKCVPI
uniref:Uncharacterized protein n=1 Tax=Anguilla anguilla TaxID=7936 RepID=A0A0E9UL04_ANGAN